MVSLRKVEALTPQLTREWKADNLVVLTMTDVRRENVDAYIKALRENLDGWGTDRVLYGVYDIRTPGMSLTPYYRERLNEFADYSKNAGKRTCSAIIVPNTFMFRIFALFGDLFTRRTGKELIDQKIFTNQDS